MVKKGKYKKCFILKSHATDTVYVTGCAINQYD